MAKSAPDSKSAIARAKLLDAGAALFFDHGFDSVSVEEIAKEAGVAHGLLFHYFKTKLDFYVEVYSMFVADLHKRRVAATASGSPEQRLRKFIQMHMQLFRQQGEAHTYHARGGEHAKVIAVSEASRQEGVLLVLSFFSSSPPPLVDQIIGRAWLGLMDQLIFAWIGNPDISEEGVIDACVELLHESLGRAHRLIGGGATTEIAEEVQFPAPRARVKTAVKRKSVR